MTICAKFDGRRIEDCTRGDLCHCAKEVKDAAGAYRLCATCENVITGDFGLTTSQCRACIAEDALRLSQKETGFVRLAYDQLVVRLDQDKERMLRRICMAIDDQANKGYSESTVRHFREVIISSFGPNYLPDTEWLERLEKTRQGI